MLGRFFHWLFSGPKENKIAEVVQQLLEPTSWFTTAINHAEDDGCGLTVIEKVKELAFPRTPQNFVAHTSGGAAITMDAACGAGCDNLGAYNMGQTGVPEAQLLWYASQGFIGYQVCAIIAQHWLIDKALTVPVEDAIRKGWTVTVNDGTEIDPKLLSKITQFDKRRNIKAQLLEFARFGRMFGIRVAMFKVDSTDPKYYEYPFNLDGVTPGSYRGIVQVDPYWCTPELSTFAATNPSSIGFYEPTWWIVNGQRVHKSHLIIFKGPEVADVLKPSYLYGGISLTQLIYERVYAAERTANEAPMLALTKRAMVLYTNTATALANENQFVGKLQKWVVYRDNYGVKVADKDGDKIEQYDTSLTDLDTTIAGQYNLVASVAKMPVTKLIGTSVKGMNATGEYDESSYHETLESIQSADLTPFLERHYLLAIRSEIAPQAPFEVDVNWNPLDTPTAAEQAQTNKTKAETGKILAEIGAIDGVDERRRVTADKESGYTGIADREIEPLAPTGGFGGEGMTSLDVSLWDSATGMYAGAVLISNQQYLDDSTVLSKIADKDFVVQVSPEFRDDSGTPYRVILDGHHSLAAAMNCGESPVFMQSAYVGSDYVNVVTKQPVFSDAGIPATGL